MKMDDILTNYLAENGVATILGDDDVLTRVNTTDNKSDAKVMELLEKSSKGKDYLIMLIFFSVLTVSSILIYKIAFDTTGVLMKYYVPLIIVFIGIMHKLWKDKIRIEKLTILLFLLPKVERLKLILAILDDSKEVNLNKLVSRFKLK